MDAGFTPNLVRIARRFTAQAIDSVNPLVDSGALFYTKNPRHLNLSKNDVIGKRLHQAVI